MNSEMLAYIFLNQYSKVYAQSKRHQFCEIYISPIFS